MTDNSAAESADVRGFDSYPVRLGDVMRGERATLGKSLLDVQRDLRIRATYIAAIENTDPSVFQTPGFIAGYVRSYARYLNLDPEATFRQFCDEAGFDGVHGEPRRRPRPAPAASARPVDIRANKPTGHSAGRDPLSGARTILTPAGDGMLAHVSASGLGSIMVLLVLILGLGYGAWAVLQDIQRVEFIPLDDTSIPVAAATAEADRAERAAALDQLYRPKELDVPVMTPRDGPIAALDPAEIGALVPDSGVDQARAIDDLAATETPRVTEDLTPEIAIVAARAAWIRVTAPDGTILFERILDGGESFRLPKGAAAALRAGNSGAVYLTLDGRAYGPVGKDTSVARNVALSAEAIVAAYGEVSDSDALKQLESPRVITLNETR
ncbi:MAG: helix-turn-helix domain-containing protein [Rhodobacteraceae bacterium]|nr:helix-turn-helix domain-containing protein [Paracoccaceae bacterium]